MRVAVRRWRLCFPLPFCSPPRNGSRGDVSSFGIRPAKGWGASFPFQNPPRHDWRSALFLFRRGGGCAVRFPLSMNPILFRRIRFSFDESGRPFFLMKFGCPFFFRRNLVAEILSSHRCNRLKVLFSDEIRLQRYCRRTASTVSRFFFFRRIRLQRYEIFPSRRQLFFPFFSPSATALSHSPLQPPLRIIVLCLTLW